MKQLGKSEMALILYAVFAVVVFVIGGFALHIPLVTALLIIIIEAGLAYCLHRVPLWMHVVVIVAELALGIFTKNVVLLILGAALYFAGVIVLGFWLRQNTRVAKKAA